MRAKNYENDEMKEKEIENVEEEEEKKKQKKRLWIRDCGR